MLASPEASISLGELAICEDFLDGHRECALDLLSNLEHILQWHTRDGCSEMDEGCMLCELCSARGLMGAASKALAAYDDVEKRLTTVRASLGGSVSTSRAPSRETLLRSSLAKAVFLSIVTTGDALRSEHATWQVRLHGEISSSLSFVENPPPPRGDLGESYKNGGGVSLLPTYSGPKVVRNSSLSAATGDSLSMSSSSSSSFIVVRRCLSSDCPCEANRANVASKTKTPRPQVASKVTPSSADSRKRPGTKMTAKSDAGSSLTMRPATNVERCSWTSNGASDVLAEETSTQIRNSSAHQDLNSPDARALETPRSRGEDNTPSNPASEIGISIMDPRVFRLRAQIKQSDDARRALIEWCRACMVDLHLDSGDARNTGPETGEPETKHRRGSCSLETYKLPDTSPVEIPTNHDDTDMALEALRFDKQEELEARWLIARQVGCKNWRSRRT